MATQKQVPPPFGVAGKQISNLKDNALSTVPSAGDRDAGVRFESGPIPVEAVDVAKGRQEEVVATLFEAQEEVKGVEQTDEQMAGNANEYWLTGRIGGLELGNRSGGGGANPFKAGGMGEKNPFGSEFGKKKVVMQEVKLFDVPEGTPDWRAVVAFVMKYGKDIQCVQFPNPPRSVEIESMGKGWSTVIDTMWRGVPVVSGGECKIQHVKHGWATWEDCVS